MRTVALVFALGLIAFMLFATHKEPERSVTINGTKITVTVADSVAERVRGLSGKESLPAGTGMWFVFDKPDYQGIWMKGMRFPIDILWLDETLAVVHIEENISPKTYPAVFRPLVPAQYVLELPAGSVKLYGFAIGNVAVQ
jgi:hypothetical protein